MVILFIRYRGFFTCSLFPIPYFLFPISYSLFPIPYFLKDLRNNYTFRIPKQIIQHKPVWSLVLGKP
ncbi:hypothetical protein [Moorena producens]|uniref:hypothetical protein n=1 Tax=Moorena producens TaxID=1155739 RepID=UPI003C772D81